MRSVRLLFSIVIMQFAGLGIYTALFTSTNHKECGNHRKRSNRDGTSHCDANDGVGLQTA